MFLSEILASFRVFRGPKLQLFDAKRELLAENGKIDERDDSQSKQKQVSLQISDL